MHRVRRLRLFETPATETIPLPCVATTQSFRLRLFETPATETGLWERFNIAPEPPQAL